MVQFRNIRKCEIIVGIVNSQNTILIECCFGMTFNKFRFTSNFKEISQTLFWRTKRGFNLLPPLPQTEMPYDRWELTKALYTLLRRLLFITFLMSQSEPAVEATFLPRYLTWLFQLNFSSIITPKNFVSLTCFSWYEPNWIAVSTNITFDSEHE